jgi:hypothetical protein
MTSVRIPNPKSPLGLLPNESVTTFGKSYVKFNVSLTVIFEK